MEEKELIKISGTVESVVYKNPSNGYVILELDSNNILITVVGEIGNIDEGEELYLEGEYVNNPKYGVQFKAFVCERKMPETAYAIQKYLSSGVIKGIGPALAKNIVDAFGEKSLEIIENNPEQLAKVKGFTKKKVETVKQELQRVFGMRKLMNYLETFKISPAIAIKAWKKWGQFSIDIIKENPYSLCDFGVDLDFVKADEMAIELEYPSDNPNRIKAGMTYILNENANSGHTCVPTDFLQKTSCQFLDISEEAFYKTLEQEYNEANLIEYKKNNRCFTYLSDYYVAERYIVSRLSAMKAFFLDSGTEFDNAIDLVEEENGIKYEELQRKAISLALSKGFLILTGGPGTGKTTTLNAIISLYEQQGLKAVIAAPTGRAAKRISDLTGYTAKTIHRLLEVAYDDGSGIMKFVHNEQNTLDCDVLIVDEMSMVDTLLFAELLRGIKLSCKLILVGDSDQLPSVGAVNLLKDLIDSKTMTVVQLTEIFRQAKESCIVTSAHRIVNGEMPELDNSSKDFFVLQRNDEQTTIETIVDLYKHRLPKAYKYNPTTDIQIISPSRKGMAGTVEINKRIQLEINPPKLGKNEIRGPVYIFRENDKVMQTRNNYDIVWKKDDEVGTGVYNGDIGVITEIRKREGVIVIDFEGKIVEYTTDMLEQLELAYAITVHKSQGSEFPAVIFSIVGVSNKLYYRNLLYTAVTRAKEILVIIGTPEMLEIMIENKRRTLRYSCFKDMLKRECLPNEESD
ncbi:MAG: ATP-dependent RecD-like DNA helicase [Oscillospiraceae bacterium]|nr:ATP-dependent RecD-like DNA helicase [Oscillospiraceae bacterium]